VPAGQYYLMGDNRSPEGSYDSRALGPVPLRDVAGRAALSVWPLVRWANTTYDCAYGGPIAPEAVKASGPLEFAPNLIRRPVVFGALR
jgi:signal peptidase I